MSHEFSFTTNATDETLLRILSETLVRFGITLKESDLGAYSIENDQGWPKVSFQFGLDAHLSSNLSPNECEEILSAISRVAELYSLVFSWEEL